MKKFLILILLTAVTYAHAQKPFAPGTFKKGDYVIDPSGTIWRMKGDLTARDLPVPGTQWEKIATPHKKDFYDITWFGAKADVPNEPPFDNAPLINNLIRFLGKGATATIFIPVGAYRCYTPIDLSETSITLQGESSSSTSPQSSKLFFMQGVRGLTYTRKTTGHAFAKVEKLHFQGSPGTPNVDGAYINNQIVINECTFSNFTGNGVYVDGSVLQGTDASLSRFTNSRFTENGKSGIRFFMEDANQCLVLACDARDNAAYGFEDQSFLGNQFIGCHGNNNQKGHFFVSNPNATATIVACYGEGGVAPSQINSNSIIVGGIHENGVTGGAAITGSRALNHFKFLTLRGGDPQSGASIGFNGPNMFWDTPGGHESGFQLRYKPQYGPDNSLAPQVSRWSMGFSNLSSDEDHYQMLGAGAYTEEPIGHPLGYKRVMNKASHLFNTLYVNNRMVAYTYEGIEKVLSFPYAQQFHSGDDLKNGVYTGSNPEGWKCTKAGTTGRYTEGRTASVTGADGFGNAVIQLSGNNTQLRIGDGIRLNGKYEGIITQFLGSSSRLILNIPIPKDSGMKIEFSGPKFRAYGNGAGPANARPQLRKDDAGWQYFNTDAGKWLTWNGNSWIG